jgi:hypothetical protein
MKCVPYVVLSMLCCAAGAAAQPAEAPAREPRPALIEVGGGLTTAVWLGSATGFPMLQARVNVTRQIAVEAAVVFDVGPSRSGVQGLYALQVRQTFGPAASKVVPFATYGVLGDFEYVHIPELRYSLSTGDTVVRPAGTVRTVSRPFGLVGGGGARVRLAAHAYLELAGQLAVADGWMPLLTAGISMPLGRGKQGS